MSSLIEQSKILQTAYEERLSEKPNDTIFVYTTLHDTTTVLDTTYIYTNATTTVYDTVVVIDSIYINNYDTTTVIQTNYDTVFVMDTTVLFNYDTTVIKDTVWAFASVNMSHERLFTALASEAERRLSEFSEQGLVNMTWAVATVKWSDEELLMV